MQVGRRQRHNRLSAMLVAAVYKKDRKTCLHDHAHTVVISVQTQGHLLFKTTHRDDNNRPETHTAYTRPLTKHTG